MQSPGCASPHQVRTRKRLLPRHRLTVFRPGPLASRAVRIGESQAPVCDALTASNCYTQLRRRVNEEIAQCLAQSLAEQPGVGQRGLVSRQNTRAESRAPALLLNSAHSWVLSRQRELEVGKVPRGKDSNSSAWTRPFQKHYLVTFFPMLPPLRASQKPGNSPVSPESLHIQYASQESSPACEPKM